MKNHDPMSNKTKGPIPLPEGEVPAGTRCVSICIPDSNEAYRTLVGALYELTHWNNWDRDSEHKGTLWAQAWRAALMQGMLQCNQFRVNGGVLQFSSDGGATWSNTPAVNDGTTGSEPQNDEPLLPPRGGSNVPCLAAANATACFVELHREVVEWYNNAAIPIICLGALALILGVFFPVSWAVFGLSLSSVTLAEAFLLHAASLNNAAFTATIQDELTCIFYCNADSYGQWNAAEFAEILVEIEAKSGDMWELIRYYVGDVAGIRGLNNAGTTTSVTSHDCSACPCSWCYNYDFLASDGGWSIVGTSGEYVLGTGWRSTDRDDHNATLGTFHVSFAPVVVNQITGHFIISATDPYPNMYIQAYRNGVVVAQTNIDVPNDTGIITRSLTVNEEIDGIFFNLDTDATTVHQICTAVQVTGAGVCTLGTPNC